MLCCSIEAATLLITTPLVALVSRVAHVALVALVALVAIVAIVASYKRLLCMLDL